MLTFPIHPARAVSSGMTSETFVTHSTFNNVDKPWQANISQNSAHKVGTRVKISLALTISRSSTDSLDKDAVFFLKCSSAGLNPFFKQFLYEVCHIKGGK